MATELAELSQLTESSIRSSETDEGGDEFETLSLMTKINTKTDECICEFELEEDRTILIENKEKKNNLAFDYLKLIIYVIILILIDFGLSKICDVIGLKFPSSVIGMILMFILLKCLHLYSAKMFDDYFFKLCKPGICFYKTWLPMFFYILLIPLPAYDIPNIITFIKIMSILIIGWAQTICFGAYFSKFLFDIIPRWNDKTKPKTPKTEDNNVSYNENNVEISWVYFLFFWLICSVIFFSISFKIWNDRILMIFSICWSIFMYILCDRMVPLKLKLYIPSTLTFTLLTICGIWLLCFAHSNNAKYGINKYIISSDLCNIKSITNFNECGAGNYLKIFLGPSVINLSVILVQKSAIISKTKWVIIITVFCNFLVSLFFTIFLIYVLSLEYFYGMPLLNRSITAPIAIEIAKIIGANPPLTAAFVVASGSFGAIFAVPLLNLLKIKNPVCRGVGGGCSSHGLGTAAFIVYEEETSAAVSAIALALMGVFGASVLSSPIGQSIKDMIN